MSWSPCRKTCARGVGEHTPLPPAALAQHTPPPPPRVAGLLEVCSHAHPLSPFPRWPEPPLCGALVLGPLHFRDFRNAAGSGPTPIPRHLPRCSSPALTHPPFTAHYVTCLMYAGTAQSPCQCRVKALPHTPWCLRYGTHSARRASAHLETVIPSPPPPAPSDEPSSRTPGRCCPGICLTASEL